MMKLQYAPCTFALLAVSGCAHLPHTYHVFLGAREQQYNEADAVPLDQAISQETGTQVVVTQGNPSGVKSMGLGGELGVTEQTGNWVTTLCGYYASYNAINYTFNIPSSGKSFTESMNPYEIGLEGGFGYNLWIFRPEVSYAWGVMNYNVTVSGAGAPTYQTNGAISYYYIGGGLALDIPISEGFHIVGEGDYRVPINTASGVSIHIISAQLGFRIGGWTSAGR